MKTLYQNIKIPALKGTKTIAKSGWSYIGSDFKNWGTDKKGIKTKETELAVLEMDKDGTFQQIFDSINSDTDSMVLTQEQIIHFCEEHKDKLNQEWPNFFLFKVGSEFFVACVYVNVGGSLEVYARRFSNDDVWHAEGRRRFVVPQLALKTPEPVTLGHPDTLELRIKSLEDRWERIEKALKIAIS